MSNAPSHAALAERFRRFAGECRAGSPLYEKLSLGIAAHDDLLALAAAGRPGQPPPNLLLAAVHSLLLAGVDHPLAAFYPNLTPAADATGDPVPALRDFCRRHADQIRVIVGTRTVQTNEVRRSACLLPAFAVVAAMFPDRPLALLEIGPSAGLNLLWDYYRYDYGPAGMIGAPESGLELQCTPHGDLLPPIPAAMPPVAERIGIDLHPIDVHDAAAVAWLRALVWPENTARFARLEQALAIARAHPPHLLAGDAVELLPTTLAALPQEAVVCVYDTFVINQFDATARDRLLALLAEQAARRPLVRISIHWIVGEQPVLDLTTFITGTPQTRVLARCDGHAAWISWLAPAE